MWWLNKSVKSSHSDGSVSWVNHHMKRNTDCFHSPTQTHGSLLVFPLMWKYGWTPSCWSATFSSSSDWMTPQKVCVTLGLHRAAELGYGSWSKIRQDSDSPVETISGAGRPSHTLHPETLLSCLSTCILRTSWGKKTIRHTHTYTHTHTYLLRWGLGKTSPQFIMTCQFAGTLSAKFSSMSSGNERFFFLSLGSVILNRNNSCLFSRQFKVVSTDWPVECEEITSCSSSICALCCNLFVFYCCPKGGKERSKFCRRTTPEKHRSELGSASDQSQKKKISRRL